jgi:hypothetical protein
MEINKLLQKMKTLHFLILLIIITISACTEKKQTEQLTEQEVAMAWAEMSLYITQYTPANTPTYASRCFGYIGLTMYESIVAGYSDYNSVVLELNGLGSLPQPEADKNYDWVLSLNAGQAQIIRSIYNQTSDKNKLKIDSLENAIYEQFSEKIKDEETAKRSAAYGKSIAEAIFTWSKTDGGHRGYLKNFDKAWEHPKREGAWQPPLYAQSFSHHPLHPHWGENRTFLQVNDSLETPQMFPYNTSENSDYYKEFLAVYEKDKELTQADKEAAIWWGDDPDESSTPPGHSYFFATQVLKTVNSPLIQCAETYARVGMAVADAFRNCWKWKYHFFSERPNTFIPKYIDQEFESFWPDPPFPAFPSGHAINAGAVSTVLIEMYGDEISLTDSSHVGRRRDDFREVDFVARRFTSLTQLANEIADSRFYGGIHTPQDNKVGLEKGKEIANNINKLPWRK